MISGLRSRASYLSTQVASAGAGAAALPGDGSHRRRRRDRGDLPACPSFRQGRRVRPRRGTHHFPGAPRRHGPLGRKRAKQRTRRGAAAAHAPPRQRTRPSVPLHVNPTLQTTRRRRPTEEIAAAARSVVAASLCASSGAFTPALSTGRRMSAGELAPLFALSSRSYHSFNSTPAPVRTHAFNRPYTKLLPV